MRNGPRAESGTWRSRRPVVNLVRRGRRGGRVGAKNSTGSRVRCEKKNGWKGGVRTKEKKKATFRAGGGRRRKNGGTGPTRPCRPPTAAPPSRSGTRRRARPPAASSKMAGSASTPTLSVASRDVGPGPRTAQHRPGKNTAVRRVACTWSYGSVCGARGVARGASATLVCAAGTAARGRIQSTMKLINCATQQEVRLN